eukprot:CAMPEP_0182469064 /NCGR_PEP_ID=MMETSP1319-20130603/16470_1 /TAXON_ID=172717 /ORGANISM="Bolidomonas pacifica, Strain RCC208" /LENGTH=105 /DNA_ID=CAMNT_0024669327 /DNA_START=131 /DNA_END=448 /DNA_ORIENTATION=+
MTSSPKNGTLGSLSVRIMEAVAGPTPVRPLVSVDIAASQSPSSSSEKAELVTFFTTESEFSFTSNQFWRTRFRTIFQSRHVFKSSRLMNGSGTLSTLSIKASNLS